MTELEKLEIIEEVYSRIKGDAIKVVDLPEIGSAIDSDHLVVEKDGMTYKIQILNVPAVSGVYTDAQARAAMDVKDNTNPYHHDRYLDAEAIAAMGIKDNSNALNHDRYADNEAVSAMGVKANNNPLNHDRYTDGEALVASIDNNSITTKGWDASKLITELANKSDTNHVHDWTVITGKPIVTDVINSINYIAPANATTGLKTNTSTIKFDMLIAETPGTPDSSEDGLLRLRHEYIACDHSNFVLEVASFGEWKELVRVNQILTPC